MDINTKLWANSQKRELLFEYHRHIRQEQEREGGKSEVRAKEDREQSERRARVMQKYDASMVRARRGTSEMEVPREQCSDRWKCVRAGKERSKTMVRQSAALDIETLS